MRIVDKIQQRYQLCWRINVVGKKKRIPTLMSHQNLDYHCYFIITHHAYLMIFGNELHVSKIFHSKHFFTSKKLVNFISACSLKFINKLLQFPLFFYILYSRYAEQYFIPFYFIFSGTKTCTLHYWKKKWIERWEREKTIIKVAYKI